jgi:tetratricopeptide (TPR) repeat protein
MVFKNLFGKAKKKQVVDEPDAAAYRAFNDGRLEIAVNDFKELVVEHPDRHDYAYMLGLAYKYLRDWPRSLELNLQALKLSNEPDQSSSWNAGIAATALGNWQEARKQWAACGLEIEQGDGPIDENYGTVSIRINPWANAETLYALRIDPARAFLMNVPLPKSGYRFRDLVLHDGAKTGERQFHGRPVPVFNGMQRLQQSEFETFAAFVVCPTFKDCDALCEMTAPGIGLLEDWTGMSYYCLRCSYGSPHSHDRAKQDAEWDPERSIGIAAQSRVAVQRLLENWADGAPGRHVDSFEPAAHELSDPEPGSVWWREPDSN